MARLLIVLAALAVLALPAAAGDGAGTLSLAEVIRTALEKHPQLRVQEEQVRVARGRRQEAAGIFDSFLVTGISQTRANTPLSSSSQASYGVNTAVQAANQTTLQSAVQRLFRNGVSVSPTVTLGRYTDNVASPGGLNTTRIGISLVVPLMRGRGYEAVGAQEHASVLETDAALLDLNHAIAQTLRTVVSSYWGALAARKNLEIAISSEERGRGLLDNVRALADAEQVPRSDLNEVTANLADRTASRIAAEQELIAARAQLAVDMGEDSSRMLAGEPSTAFPEPALAALPGDAGTYTGSALLHRADYLAAKKRAEEARVLTVGARKGLLPQVDFSLGTGYSGLKEGTRMSRYLASPFGSPGGPDLAAGITYTFPAGNRAALGRYVQADAGERQADWRTADLARNIRAATVAAFEAVRHAAARLETAGKAVDAFRAALEGQREKYRLGSGSVVEILTVEDRLNSALLNQVQAQLAYAQALAQLLYATGSVVLPDRTTQTIDPAIFLAPAAVGTE